METTKDKILRLLDTLPEPYNKQAVANFRPMFCKEGARIDSNYAALRLAFDWETSPEGGDYWLALYDRLQGRNPLPEIKEAKHTPTPLIIGDTLNHVGVHSDGRDWLTRIYANGKTVFIAVGSTEKESAEHAAFIVKACNSYGPMLKALTNAHDKFNKLINTPGWAAGNFDTVWPELKEIGDAIKSATE